MILVIDPVRGTLAPLPMKPTAKAAAMPTAMVAIQEPRQAVLRGGWSEGNTINVSPFMAPIEGASRRTGRCSIMGTEADRIH